jgi:hypothetical protein
MALSTPIDLTQRGLTANAGVTTPNTYPHSQIVKPGACIVASGRFDGPAATTLKGAAIATSDVFPLVNVPAGAFVLTVSYKVITAEGATCTFGLGDGSGTSGYASAANGNTTTNATSFNGTTTPTYGVGKLYTAADTIDLILSSGTAATAVIDVSVTYIPTLPLES